MGKMGERRLGEKEKRAWRRSVRKEVRKGCEKKNVRKDD